MSNSELKYYLICSIIMSILSLIGIIIGILNKDRTIFQYSTFFLFVSVTPIAPMIMSLIFTISLIYGLYKVSLYITNKLFNKLIKNKL